MPLLPGTRLGPYEIVALVGAGGMGEVWRARDSRLGRDVAIKVLPAELSSDSDRLRRFEQEARAISALSHPNLLALYDVGTHEGSPYLVEELLEGASLRDTLAAGPLTPRRAVEVAAQIASGLAAAHARGIVHRDVKPENVFLTGDGVVKLLDFGLAKLGAPPTAEEDAGATTVTGATAAGTVLGTVAYMSPEQARGRPVDARTDIFSLGVVLYEMLAGVRPFRGETASDTLVAILSQEPPALGAGVRDCPPQLERLVRRCLEKAPEDRFQSARDLALDLRALASEAAGGRAGPALAPSAPRRRLAWRVAAGFAAVVVAAGAVLLLRGSNATTGVALEPKRIVVAVFENRSGDRSLDPLGRMASDWIAQGLSQIPSVDVMPTSVTISAERMAARQLAEGSRVDPLRALAEQTGAGIVVSGSYYLVGQELQAQAKVTDAAHGTLIYGVGPVAGRRESPMAVLEALRQRVLGVVAIHCGSEIGPEVRTPPLFEAYREFVAGIELYGMDFPESIRHFERASQLDPDFFSPQIWAAVAYGFSQSNYARADAIIRRVNEHRERLTPFEADMVDWYGARLAGHDAAALEALQQALKLAPRSAQHAYLVALWALKVNHPRQTVDTFSTFTSETVLGLPWVSGSSWLNAIAEAHHMLGSYDRELEVSSEAIRLFPDLLTVRSGRVRALAALGRLDELQRTIDEALSVQSRAGSPADLMRVAVTELRAHRQRDAARRVADQAIDWLESRPEAEKEKEPYRPALAVAFCSAERWEEARAVYLELAARHPVASGYPGPPGVQAVAGATRVRNRTRSGAIDFLGSLGAIAARRGERAEAERISGELGRIELPYTFGQQTYWRACIASQLGEKQRAVDLLREAISQGDSYDVDLHCDPELEPLWDYPPFLELLRPRG